MLHDHNVAIGRSGMLSGLIFLIGEIIAQKQVCFKLPLIILFCAFVFATYGQLLKMEQLNNFTQGIERIERLGSTDQRGEINSQYMSNLAAYPSHIIFGAPLSEILAINEVEGNPHNAYIRLHITFGLFGFLIFVGLLIFAIFRLVKNKMKLTVIVLLVAVFRLASDSAAFHGPLDVIIFYCIFRALRNIKFTFKLPSEKYES